MTELSALAVSEGYAACDDDGGLYCQKRPSRAFFDSLKPVARPASFILLPDGHRSWALILFCSRVRRTLRRAAK